MSFAAGAALGAVLGYRFFPALVLYRLERSSGEPVLVALTLAAAKFCGLAWWR